MSEKSRIQKTTIRPATPADIPAMQAIERAAGQLFFLVDMPDIATDDPFDAAVLTAYVEDGRAWIAVVGGVPVGYALADIVDGQGHLEQVSVDPAHGRQRIGRRLIEQAAAWARGRSYRELTLRTFRDVPWNGPYYRTLGFEAVSDEDVGPGLQALRERERELGLNVALRQAMRLDLTEHDR